MPTFHLSNSQKSHGSPGTNGNGNGGSSSPDENWPLVCLCDDSEFDLIAIERMLARHGFRVICARNYAAAVAVFGSSWKFAAIICDYYMPRGEPDGFEILKKAQELQPDAARIMITADPIAQNLVPLIGATWFDKSDSAMGLVRVLRKLLRRRGH